jgi:hypothetical protein
VRPQYEAGKLAGCTALAAEHPKASGMEITQGQAIRRQDHDRLAELIDTNRADPARREKVVWGALRGIKVDDLAVRLLTAGITCRSRATGSLAPYED